MGGALSVTTVPGRRVVPLDALPASPLYVITTVFNAPRSQSRWTRYQDFARWCTQAGAELYTVEIAFGDRAFAVTNADDPRHIQLRTWHELWFKENAINLAVQRLPADWQKVAWIDADVILARPAWVEETLQALEHWPVIQLWSQMSDLDDRHELVGSVRSFADVWVTEGRSYPDQADRRIMASAASYVSAISASAASAPYSYPSSTQDVWRHPGTPGHVWRRPGAPGLAWAMRREAWDQLGGLIDCCILGAGDWYMAHALTDQLDRVLHGQTPRLHQMLRQWADRARYSTWRQRPLINNLGVLKGLALHYWHGPKQWRRYGSREQILLRHGFDPDLDLCRDAQGLYALTNHTPALRRDIQRYLHDRQEDAPRSRTLSGV